MHYDSVERQHRRADGDAQHGAEKSGNKNRTDFGAHAERKCFKTLSTRVIIITVGTKIRFAAVDDRRKVVLRDRRKVVVRFGDGIPELVAVRRLQGSRVRTDAAGTKSQARGAFSKHGLRDGHVWGRG